MSTFRRISAATALAGLLLAASPAAELPRKAPDFTINLPGGKKLPLSDYHGHAVIVTFILTTCTHCQATVGVLNKLQKEYAARGLQIVASALDDNAQAAIPVFVRYYQPPYPVGFNARAAAAQFIQPTGKLPQMPLMAFIDKQGIIRSQHEGEEPFFENLEANLRTEIEGLLKSPAPAKKK